MTAFSMTKHYTLLIAPGALYTRGSAMAEGPYKSGGTVKNFSGKPKFVPPNFQFASVTTGSESNQIDSGTESNRIVFGESPITSAQ